MLIVGYDRVRHFFVVKNSWGPVHYDANQLAPDLKDIATKYDGYTLVDYNYLPEVFTAGFITQVANPNAPKYANQSLMGSWTLTVKNLTNGHEVFTGTLSWRHLPGTDFNMDGRETRIGDLYGKLNGGPARNYRVNGQIGNLVSIYVDFAHPAAGLTTQPGLRFSGILTRFAHQLLINNGSVFGTETLGGVPAQSLGYTLVRS